MLLSTKLIPSIGLAEVPGPEKAPDRNRTGDLVLTKDVLYQLSYRGSAHSTSPNVFAFGFVGIVLRS